MMDKEVNGADGWNGEMGAEVTCSNEASVNAARVAVCHLLMWCNFILAINALITSNSLNLI